MNNVYGTKRPANITQDDVDIFYYYRPNRAEEDSEFTSFKRLSETLLSESKFEKDNLSGEGVTLPGMYNLKLPIEEFSKKGIYTIYIKPKEIITHIKDVASLVSYPTIKGIVIEATNLKENMRVDGGLIGYRVEYFDEDDNRIQDFRLITSSNKCAPYTQVPNATRGSVGYGFDENSNILFCTLTPSADGNSFKANSKPFIGDVNQKIALINTKFDPICIEVEMVEHDEETISWMLEGDQIRNLETGVITTFNNKNEIYHQFKTGHITDIDSNIAHDVKINAGNIIDSEEADSIIDIKTQFNNGR